MRLLMKKTQLSPDYDARSIFVTVSRGELLVGLKADDRVPQLSHELDVANDEQTTRTVEAPEKDS